MTSTPMFDLSQAHLETPSAWYRNHYHCPYCQQEWPDEWDCACNDKCPACNKELEPYASDLIEI